MVIQLARASVRRAGGGAIVEIGGAGVVGRGEASPLESRSRETLEESIAVIRRVLGELRELDDDDDAKIAIASTLKRFDADLARAPAACFALETALFEVFSKLRQVSIAELLGGPRPYSEIGINALLRLTDDTTSAVLIERASELGRQGFAALKLKLPAARGAKAFDRALALLLDLRAEKPHVELRLDVNGAWTSEEARGRLELLGGVGLRYVEQPVAPADVECLASSPVPWAADESLEHPDVDAERLLATGPCAAFVLKPTCIGGLLRARALGELALSRGAEVVVTHALDGPIALAAARELALSFSRPPLACGLAPHPGLDRWSPDD